MDGFQKIDLTEKKASKEEDVSKRTRPKSPLRFPKLSKKYLSLLPIIIIFLVIAFFVVLLPAQATYASALKAYRQSQLVITAFKQQNIDLAKQELEKTKTDLAATKKNLNRLSYLKFVPIANWYYNDADHLVNAGIYGLDSATIVVDSLLPYADVLGLKGQGSFVGGSAQNRIKTAVLTLGKITPRIDSISESLTQAKKEIDQVNPGHYPSIIFGPKLNKQIVQAKDLADQGIAFVHEARPLIKVLPELLGEKEEKKYLLLFQNDKELRATGGFLTAYAIFRVEKGLMQVEKSEDIYALDNSVPNKPPAPEPIKKYLPQVPLFNLRDSNLSPDYIESMKTFKSFYDRAGRKVDVDGIIAIDTYVLVSIIKILDDSVTASGITFTTKPDKRCDCPQVIYELEDNISRPVGFIRDDRKGLIGSLMYAIMQKALSSSPKIYWGPLFQSLIMQANQKHILVFLYDKDAQSGIEALNMAGRIQPFEGDYLHINNTNFGGAKSNLFVTEEVKTTYEVQSDGSINKTVTIDYKNPYPPSDCNLERGGLCLNAELRDWLRVYVPKGSKLISSEGSEVKIATKEDLGKTVFEGFLRVAAKGSKTFTITYGLPFKLDKGSQLPLLIQKQPGTFGHKYTVTVKNRIVDEFELFADKELTIKL